MANYEATKYDFTGANLTNIDLVNTGLIIPWTDGSVPSGFLECDGSAVSRSTYAALFAVIGTTYGSGNGSTTFNVPDLQDDNAMGKSNNILHLQVTITTSQQLNLRTKLVVTQVVAEHITIQDLLLFLVMQLLLYNLMWLCYI